MYHQFDRDPVPPVTGSNQKKVIEYVEKEQVETFNDSINSLLDSLPVRSYSPTSSSSDDDPAVGSKGGCGGSTATGARVFKKARRGATKTTLRLKVGPGWSR